MSKSKIYISQNHLNDIISSSEMINEYKNKYKNKDKKIPKKPKSQILFNTINYYNKSKINKLISKINNEIEKLNYDNKSFAKAKKTPINKNNKNIVQNKNKTYTLNDTNKNNILLETEKETINNLKPEPLPVKIDKHNKIDYNSIMKNNFTKKHNNINLLVNNIKKEIKNKDKDIKLIFALKNLDLRNLIDCFNYHNINFSDLFRLNKQDLLEMNIPIGPRNRIINFINEYSKYSKNYDLNELKEFFYNKKKNGIIINDKQQNNYNISCYDNIYENKENDNEYNSYYRNIANISIFNNYYGNKINKQNHKNKTKIKNNKSNINNEEKCKFVNKNKNKANNLFNKYNSMSNVLNNNILYRNENNNVKRKSFESLLTFNGEKKSEINDVYNSALFKKEEINKKSFDKSHTLKAKKINNIYKAKEKRKNFMDNFSNINEEVKVFESHLKEIRKKSLETNFKVENLLSKRRNSAFFCRWKSNIIKSEYDNYDYHIILNKDFD